MADMRGRLALVRYVVIPLILLLAVCHGGAALVRYRPRAALALGAVLVAAFTAALVHERWRFQRTGYRLTHSRDVVLYRERDLIGGQQGMAFDAGDRVVYVPGERQWNLFAPMLAQGRRGEILSRMQQRMGKRWKLIESPDAQCTPAPGSPTSPFMG